MARRLSKGRTKATFLVDPPANGWLNPTAAELTAGHDGSCNLRLSSFNFSAQPSTTQDTTHLCNRSTALTPTDRQHVGEAVVDRGYGVNGQPDPQGDDETAQLILANMGSIIGVYVRETSKWSTDAWAAEDEIRIGGAWIPDVPERGDLDDNIKFTARFLPQEVGDYFSVASGGGGGG